MSRLDTNQAFLTLQQSISPSHLSRLKWCRFPSGPPPSMRRLPSPRSPPSVLSLGLLPPRTQVSRLSVTITLMFLTRTEAEKAQRQSRKELERVAKTQRKHAAKEHKAQAARVKQQQKAVTRQQKEAKKRHRKAAHEAKRAAKTRNRVARKTAQERKRRARFHSTVAAPPFAKRTGCYVCGKTFSWALSRRRHHCRQCRESCCLHCMSQTRRAVPLYGLDKPQKVCVVCATLVLDEERPREPVEAATTLAANRTTSRRPHSAPLPPTGVAVTMPSTRRGRSKSRSAMLWTLPIRPLLKKKKIAEQLRNRTMDFNLQIDKQTMSSGRSIELQSQTIIPPML